VPVPERSDEPPVILWNQRWEYDKAPETFFRALYALADNGIEFRVVISGPNHRQTAPEFEAARQHLGGRVVHFGYAADDVYPVLLQRSDVVVGTAIHEFFGVAVVEAIYSGCFPVLPDRLSFPELIPQVHHDICLYRDFDGLLARLRWALANPDAARAIAHQLRSAVVDFDWARVAPVYDRLLGETGPGSADCPVDIPS
jgi:glycosyltransferase involved in cell wall biosynthesis